MTRGTAHYHRAQDKSQVAFGSGKNDSDKFLIVSYTRGHLC